MDSTLASHPAAPGSDLGIPIFLGKLILMLLDQVNQWRCLEESGKRLENVDRTHLVLARGKLVIQKICDNKVSFYTMSTSYFLRLNHEMYYCVLYHDIRK